MCIYPNPCVTKTPFWTGDIARCRELVELGANTTIPDNDGFTPAYISQCKGYDEIFKFFVEETDVEY